MEKASQYLNILVSKNIFKYLFFSIIILGSFFIFGIGKASAATYKIQKSDYSANKVMYKSGAWPTTHDGSGVVDSTDIDNILRFVGSAGDTFEIDGGLSGLIYSGTELSSTNCITNVSGNGKIIQGSTEAGHSGQVSLSGVSATVPTVTIGTALDTIWNKIKFTGAILGQYQLVSSKSLTLNDCIIGDSPGRAFYQSATGTTWTFNRTIVKNNLDTARTATIAAGATFNMNYFTYYNNAANLYIGASTFNLSNGVVAGNHALLQPVIDFEGAATSEIKNVIFTGNVAKRTNKHIIQNGAGATVTVSNSVLQPHPTNPSTYGYQNITNGGGNIYTSPKVTSQYGGKALIAIGVDDYYGNINVLDPGGYTDAITPLVAYANTKGIKVYFALSHAQAYSDSDWNNIKGFVASGHEITVHSRSHVDAITTLGVGALKIIGPANSTVTIATTIANQHDSTTWAGTLTCKVSGSAVRTIDISSTALTGTIFGLVTDINTNLGGTGWTASTNTSAPGLYASTLTNVADQAVTGAGSSFPSVLSLFAQAEYIEQKELIESKIGSGYIASTCPYSGGQYTAALQSYLIDANNFVNGTLPFLGSRSAYVTEGSWTFLQNEFTSGTGTTTGSKVMEISGPNINSFITTTNIKINTDAYIDYLAVIGGVTFFYTHKIEEYSLANLQTFVDAVIANPSAQILTPKEIIATIRQQTDLDSNGLRWGRANSIDASDYHLRSGSPAIDAGTNVSLTTDFAGNKIYGSPDIGGYEYQPPHDLTIATPDKINIGAGARIYGDGKFRDVGTTGASTADIKITPSGGTFSETTSPIPAWLDVAVSTWSNTGNHHKAWTESNAEAALTNTDHTIGDLENNKYYNITVDTHVANLAGTGCVALNDKLSCKSNGSGKIAFTYGGTYSTHTFDVTEGDNTAPITTASPTGNTFNTDQTVTLSCGDGSGSGCDKTYYTLTGVDPTTGSTQYTSTPINIPINIPSNATTILKYFSTDLTGNSEAIKSQTYIIDTVAPNTTIDTHPNSNSNSATGSFIFSSSEPTNATFECKIDDGSYSTCTSPYEYDFTDGTRTFYARDTDQAGNTDTTPSEFTWTIDTINPILTLGVPNGQILANTTTSATFHADTNETSTCKYSTTSGADFASMTEFETTGDATHSTLITGLNSGTTYNYYLKCQDSALNESAEGHLTFSIAPEENNISINSVKVKIKRTWNKFKDTLHIAKKKLKLKQKDSDLANGTVKIYQDGKRIKTLDIDSNGAWDYFLKLKDSFSGMIKIKLYGSNGNLLDTQKAKVKIDTEDPTFTLFPPDNKTIYTAYQRDENRALVYQAEDNEEINKYKIEFDGRITNKKPTSGDRDKPQAYFVPKDTPRGTYTFKVSAYDQAGNRTEKETRIIVRASSSVSMANANYSQYDQVQNQVQGASESNIGNDNEKNNNNNNNNNNSNSDSSSNQSETKESTPTGGFRWWNPFTWF